MRQNTAKSIAAELKQRIRTGEIAPGARVPSAREIVARWGVAIATASRVLAILRKEGLVRVQPGVGTIVKTGTRSHELSREQVLRAGIAIADEEGVVAATLRQIALELGVATVVVERVIETLDALHLQMADLVLGDVPIPSRSEPREAIAALLRAQWRGYVQHPWVPGFLSMTRPQLMPNGMRHTEALLVAISSFALGRQRTMRTAVTLLAFVRGIAADLESEVQARQDTGMSSEEWMDSREALFAGVASGMPMLWDFTRQPGIDMSLDALFEEGLALLLDGLSAASARSARPRAAPPRARPRGSSPR